VRPRIPSIPLYSWDAREKEKKKREGSRKRKEGNACAINLLHGHGKGKKGSRQKRRKRGKNAFHLPRSLLLVLTARKEKKKGGETLILLKEGRGKRWRGSILLRKGKSRKRGKRKKKGSRWLRNLVATAARRKGKKKGEEGYAQRGKDKMHTPFPFPYSTV